MRDGATLLGGGGRPQLGRAAVFVLAAAAAAAVYPAMAANPPRTCALRCASSRKCVSDTSICDGFWDCPNGEDETDAKCSSPMDTSQCILSDTRYCDGIRDCPDGSDEANCGQTTLPHSNLGSDWLWTWPLVGAVLCAIVCTAVALSLRCMRLKRQQRQAARRRAAAEAASASAQDAATAAGLRLPSMTLPSYAEATSVPYAAAFSNLGYSLTPAELPPDYLEAIREAERMSAQEHLQKQQQQQRHHHCTADCGDRCGGESSSSSGSSPDTRTSPESMLHADDELIDVDVTERVQRHPPHASLLDLGVLPLRSPVQQASTLFTAAAATVAAGGCGRDDAALSQTSVGAKLDGNTADCGTTVPASVHAIPVPSYDAVVAGDGVLFLSPGAPRSPAASVAAAEVRNDNDQSAYLRYSMC